MKHISILIAILFMAMGTYAQTTVYNFKVKSIKENGTPILQDLIKAEDVTLMLISSSKGAELVSYAGKNMLNAGKLTLINKAEQKETKDMYRGYIIEYMWYPTDYEGVKSTYHLKLRVIITPGGDRFVLDQTQEDQVYQYEGILFQSK